MMDGASFVPKHRVLTLLKAAFPLALTMQVGSLVAIVGSMWIGRLIGSVGLAVRAAMIPIEQTGQWLIGVVTTGTSVLVSRATGARQPVQPIVASGLRLSLLAGLAAAAVGLLARHAIATQVVGGQGELVVAFTRYFSVWVSALPVYACMMLLITSFVATGRMYFGLARTACELAFVFVVTPVLIAKGKLGITGPPLSIAIAQVLMLFSLLRLPRVGRDLEPPPRIWRSIAALGGPTQLVRTAGWIVQAVIAGIIVRHSITEGAAFAVLVTATICFCLVTLAIARATGIFVAQAIGRADSADARRWAGTAMRVQLAAGLTLCVVFASSGAALSLFTHDAAVVASARAALPWFALAVLPTAICQLLLELYTSAGGVRLPTMLLVSSELVVLAYVSFASDPLRAMAYAAFFESSVRVVLLASFYRRSFLARLPSLPT